MSDSPRDFIIENSWVSRSAEVFGGARIRHSTIGSNAIVGSFARIDETVLGDYVRVERSNQIVSSKIARFSYTGINTVIMHTDVGPFCSISWGVTLGGAEHDYRRISQHSFVYNQNFRDVLEVSAVQYNRFASPLQVGADVWIGSGACVLRGVTIGTGAVVGANSTVTKDVDPYSVVAGSPARVIGQRFSNRIISELLNIRWWDLPIDELKKISDTLAMVASETSLSELRKKLDL